MRRSVRMSVLIGVVLVGMPLCAQWFSASEATTKAQAMKVIELSEKALAELAKVCNEEAESLGPVKTKFDKIMKDEVLEPIKAIELGNRVATNIYLKSTKPSDKINPAGACDHVLFGWVQHLDRFEAKASMIKRMGDSAKADQSEGAIAYRARNIAFSERKIKIAREYLKRAGEVLPAESKKKK